MKYEHRYFKDEEQFWEGSQWKELFENFRKLITIGDWLIHISPIYLTGQFYHHDNHGYGPMDEVISMNIAGPSQRAILSMNARFELFA